jgi:2',3'-cyclic-nucleotide 2'-phosphodiesterase
MRILFIADVVGRPGRRLVGQLLPAFIQERDIDFVIANGENAAGGRGLTPKVAKELFKAGVDVLTSGNHIWRNRDVLKIIDEDARILRPANYPDDDLVPGRGFGVFDVPGIAARIGVVNLLGRVFLEPVDCPFRVGRDAVETLLRETSVVFVDIHAEATSEKIALGWHLDGLATAVIGTHTHVPTADEMITPNGTALQTDAGMTGAFDGVLGVKKEIILHGMTTHLPVRHELAEGDLRLCGTLIDADEETGRATRIERVCLRKETTQPA